MVKQQAKPAAKKALAAKRISRKHVEATGMSSALYGSADRHGRPAHERAPSPSPIAQEMLKAQAALLNEMRSLRRELLTSNLRLAKQGRVLNILLRERRAATAGPAMAPAVSAPTGENRAAAALSVMRERLGITPETAAKALAAQSQASETVKAEWIREGLLIGSTELSAAWGCSRQALEQACERDELFSLKIGNRRWYPASLLRLAAADVARVCLHLAGLEPVAKFIAWERQHGGLKGKTIPEAIGAGHIDDAARVAEALAEEANSSALTHDSAS